MLGCVARCVVPSGWVCRSCWRRRTERRATRLVCWCHSARATTRLSFLVADTRSSASRLLSPVAKQKLFIQWWLFFFIPDPPKKNTACVCSRRFSQRISDFLEEQREAASPWFWISSKSSPSSRWQVRLLTVDKSPKHYINLKMSHAVPFIPTTSWNKVAVFFATLFLHAKNIEFGRCMNNDARTFEGANPLHFFPIIYGTL